MSTTTITVTLQENNARFDPDSMQVALSDVAGQRSIIRTDTGALVAPVPTVPVAGLPATAPLMTRLSVGVYSYTVTDPAGASEYQIFYCGYRGNVPFWFSGIKQASTAVNPATSLSVAQSILGQLYGAMAAMASNAGYQTITIDGQQTEFRSLSQLQGMIEYWKKQVALLDGSRRRVMNIDMGCTRIGRY